MSATQKKFPQHRFFHYLLCLYSSLILLIGLPLFLYGDLSFLDACFEGCSAATLTGASILAHPEDLGNNLLLWRSISAWFCGLGTILLFIFCFPCHQQNSILLSNEEFLELKKINDSSLQKKIALCITILYILLTAVIFTTLLANGLNLHQTTIYTLGTVSTTGFHCQEGIACQGLSPIVQVILGIGMLLAGGNYIFYSLLLHTGWSKFKENSEIKVYLVLILVFTLLLTSNFYFAKFNEASIQEIFFQCASFLSTTGYAATNINRWPVFAHVVFGFLLLVGGCACSTAGGLKICRLTLLVKQLNRDIINISSPKLINKLYFNGYEIGKKTLGNVSFFFLLYMIEIFLLAIILAMDGFKAVDALFTAAGIFSNTGVVLSSTFGDGSFVLLSNTGKISVILGMLLGRLEIWGLLVILLPEFWHEQKNW